MDAIELLYADHQKASDIFDRLEHGPSVLTGADEQQLRARGELVAELVILQCQHEAVEEQFFWPWFAQHCPMVTDSRHMPSRRNKTENGSSKIWSGPDPISLSLRSP
jgi:hypothetical protein